MGITDREGDPVTMEVTGNRQDEPAAPVYDSTVAD
jgi:hypothetical protein